MINKIINSSFLNAMASRGFNMRIGPLKSVLLFVLVVVSLILFSIEFIAKKLFMGHLTHTENIKQAKINLIS